MIRCHSLVRKIAVLVVLLVGLAATLEAQRDFYLNRLRDGHVAYDRGDFAEAARSLEIACFGVLEQTEVLAECLARLALAQAAQGDEVGYRRTFDRLVEIEERFGAYASAALDPELRTSFESSLSGVLPVEIVQSNDTFRSILAAQGEAREASRLAGMSESQQIERLRGLIAQRPDSIAERLELSEIEYRNAKYPAVAQYTSAILELEPEHRRARCLLASSLANERKRCEWSLAELEQCPGKDSGLADIGAARGTLRCLVELERWRDAQAFVAGMEPLSESDPAITKLVRSVDRRVTRLDRTVQNEAPEPDVDGEAGETTDSANAARESAPSTAAEIAAATNRSTDRPDTEPSNDRPPKVERPPSALPRPPLAHPYQALLDRLPAADGRRVEEAHRALVTASDIGSVEGALVQARDIADRHPEDADAQLLAGEIAYRVRRFATALEYFRRAGNARAWQSRPDLVFYHAVAAYESGYRDAASELLQRCLPQLRADALVDSYRRKILG